MVNLDKFRDLFLSEARELLDNLDAGLIKFEKNPKDAAITKELMRYAHTLKGISAEMGFGDLSNLSHSFEGMIENIKNGIAKGGVSMLFGVLDELRSLVEKAAAGGAQTKANPLVDKAGELEERDKDKEANIIEKPESFNLISEVKVKTDKLDKLVDSVAELLVNKLQLDEAVGNSDKVIAALELNARLVAELQHQVLDLRLTPIFHVFNRFPRMVRDLATKTNKKVDLVTLGGDIELDRSILDAIGEPLVHILRNAVDHGIDKEGTIELSAVRDKDLVLVKVRDNGQGVKWDDVKSKYLERYPGKTPDIEELKNFLFSGVSTSTEVTEISGRGVGLEVVKATILKLGGHIELNSPLQGGIPGTEFVLKLPVSLAIIKALLIEVSEQIYAVPLSVIDRLVDIKQADRKMQADQEITILNEEEVPLVDMGKIFTNVIDVKSGTGPASLAIVTQIKGKRVGFMANRALRQQDIIVKPISDSLRKGGYFSSVTILGDGNPVPIVDLSALIKA